MQNGAAPAVTPPIYLSINTLAVNASQPNCPAGSYRDEDSGECAACGIGYFCPDGIDRIECVDWETTMYENSTHEDDCFVAACNPCMGNGEGVATAAYFATAT